MSCSEDTKASLNWEIVDYIWLKKFMCLTVAVKKNTKPWEILVQQRLAYERVIAFTDVLEATKKIRNAQT